MITKDTNISKFIVSPHHTAVSVKDFEKAKHFFINVIGMRLENEWKNRNEKELSDVVGLKDVKAHIAILELNDYRLELFEYLNPPVTDCAIKQNNVGLTHICFQVNNVNEVYRKLIDAGYKAISPPISLRGGKSKPFYMYGPENIVIEFIQLF